MSQFEQRAKIKFMCRWGKSTSETLSVLHQVYGDTALKKTAVYYWFSRFKNGKETLEDDQRIGRPSTSKTEEMIKKSGTSYSMWSKNDHRGVGTSRWHLPRIHSCDSVRRFDEACQCEVCSVAAEHGSDGMPHDCRWRCLRKVRTTQSFSQRSSLKISHGCSPTTRRRRCNQQSSTQRRLPDQKTSRLVKSKEKWCSLHLLRSTMWCTMSSYRLDRLFVVTSTCKYCRGGATQIGGNSATSGRESGFCITITHRDAHRLLCSNSSPRKAFLSSSNHRTLRISLRVTFGCSLR